MVTNSIASSESAIVIADRYRSITRIARVAEWLAIGAMVMIGAFGAFLWFDQDRLYEFISQDVPGVITPPTSMAQLVARLVATLPAILLVMTLWQARNLFALYRRKRVFDAAIPIILIRMGYLSITAATLGIFARTAVILLLTSSNPPGHGQLSFGVSSGEIMALIAGLLLLAFSLVMQETRRIAEENESFV